MNLPRYVVRSCDPQNFCTMLFHFPRFTVHLKHTSTLFATVAALLYILYFGKFKNLTKDEQIRIRKVKW